jgi:hypothetical protein
MKRLKFKAHLIPHILSGEKEFTWRMFDDKDLKEKDEVEIINSDTGKSVGKVVIVSIKEKKLGEINELDFDNSHYPHESREETYERYRRHYGDGVDADTALKIIQFKLLR